MADIPEAQAPDGSRKRWYAELAGTILLWIEEAHDNPPFTCRGFIQRRDRKVPVETEDGPAQGTQRFDPDSFWQLSVRAAMNDLENTVKAGPQFSDYARRLGELHWEEWTGTEQEWINWATRFMATGRID